MTTRVNWNDPYDVLICRPSIYGNPYSHKDGTLARFKTSSKKESILKFKEYFDNSPELQEACKVLKGKRIACQCKINEKCHGDIYIEFLHRNDIFDKLSALQ